MTVLAWLLVAVPIALFVWAYVGYPTALLVCGRGRPVYRLPPEPDSWPTISISLPAHNEEKRLRGTLEALLEADYPTDRRQIVVISDASTDATDQIAGEFADRGVELLRLDDRQGKTAAENAAAEVLRGEIVVNTDASVKVLPESIKPLIRALEDPDVGVASGRDVSVGPDDGNANVGESGYVGYEMWVRSLETRVGSIVGASGCFYAIRSSLHRRTVPIHLSRDFGAVLFAKSKGFRSVSVNDALCVVPRTASLRLEFRRKVRTMARGLDTLWHYRGLLNPLGNGGFAISLASHKLCRWLVLLLTPGCLLGLLLLGLLTEGTLGEASLYVAVATLIIGPAAVLWTAKASAPRLVTTLSYVVSGHVAGFFAWLQFFTRRRRSTWEPTRRETPPLEPL